MFVKPAHMLPRFVLILGTTVGMALFAATMTPPVWAERPSAMKLFPEDTLLFVRMRNAKEFGEALRESSTGRMLRDPQVQPFVADVYGKAGEVYTERAEAFLGLSWEDLKRLPQGEVAFGIVTRPGQAPAFLLLVDQGEGGSAAQKLLERGLDVASERGSEFSSEKIGDVEVTVIKDPERPERMFGIFERENTIVVATDPEVIRNVLWHWDAVSAADDGEAASAAGDSPQVAESGEEETEFTPGRTLAENNKFSTILRNSRRPQDPPPHAIFFIDPIGLFREFGQGETGARVAMGFLPMLGLDGVGGAGATLTFASGGFETLTHAHLLLDNPRAGVLQLVTFESGDTAPQPFVPFATENYYTTRWNAPVFYDRVQQLVDKLLGEGTFDRQFVKEVQEDTSIDFRAEIVDNLAGRFTLVCGYEKPATFRSQKYTLVVELVDQDKAQETLKKFIDKTPGDFEERRFGDVTYHAITPEWWREMDEDDRPFNPYVAIVDGNLFVGGSTQLFEEMIAARDGTIARLADSEDYSRVTSTLGRETAGLTPVLFLASRPEESIRHLYELLTSEQSREFLESQAEEHPLAAKLVEALKDHPLPPFDTLMQYYGPGGGILYDTDTGYHGISFTLENEVAPAE